MLDESIVYGQYVRGLLSTRNSPVREDPCAPRNLSLLTPNEAALRARVAIAGTKKPWRLSLEGRA